MLATCTPAVPSRSELGTGWQKGAQHRCLQAARLESANSHPTKSVKTDAELESKPLTCVRQTTRADPTGQSPASLAWPRFCGKWPAAFKTRAFPSLRRSCRAHVPPSPADFLTQLVARCLQRWVQACANLALRTLCAQGHPLTCFSGGGGDPCSGKRHAMKKNTHTHTQKKRTQLQVSRACHDQLL